MLISYYVAGCVGATHAFLPLQTVDIEQSEWERMMLRRPLVGALATLLGLLISLVSLPVSAAIPTSQRDVLLAIYNQTNGAGWTSSTNWNGAAGTECIWYGITCVGDTVTAVDLSGNHLQGTLPSITDLVDLVTFNAGDNQLSGSLPAIAGMASLRRFAVYNNQLTGAIPALTGLPNLREFIVQTNQLSGSIPSLAGATNLTDFFAYANQLTGSIPALSGLTHLVYFYVNNNQLTGNIPSLSGLTSLVEFYVHDNQLTGPIPSLTGLSSLAYFYAEVNQLSGSIPPLNGLTALQDFVVHHNQLTGSVPPLDSLSSLVFIQVHNNQLTGAAPTPPAHAAHAGSSQLCPNYLTPASSPPSVIDLYWNAATGTTPWSSACTEAPVAITVPTLSQWTLGLLSLLLAGVAALVWRRRV